MPQALPIDVARRDPEVDLAFVQVLRLALRGCRSDDAVVEQVGMVHGRDVLLRTLGRFDRLAADEPTPTVERARSLVRAALVGGSMDRSA